MFGSSNRFGSAPAAPVASSVRGPSAPAAATPTPAPSAAPAPSRSATPAAPVKVAPATTTSVITAADAVKTAETALQRAQSSGNPKAIATATTRLDTATTTLANKVSALADQISAPKTQTLMGNVAAPVKNPVGVANNAVTRANEALKVVETLASVAAKAPPNSALRTIASTTIPATTKAIQTKVDTTLQTALTSLSSSGKSSAITESAKILVAGAKFDGALDVTGTKVELILDGADKKTINSAVKNLNTQNAAELKAFTTNVNNIAKTEASELRQLGAAQKAEIFALTSEGKKLGIPKSELNALVKAETKANTAESADAIRTLAAVNSRTEPAAQTIAKTNEAGRAIPITSAAGAYADNAQIKTAVDTVIGGAVKKMQDLNLSPLSVERKGNATITSGVGLDTLTKTLSRRNPETGEFSKDTRFTRLITDSEKYIGQNVSPNDLAAAKLKLTAIPGQEGLLTAKSGSNYYIFKQNTDGTLTGIGSTSVRIDEDKGFLDKLGALGDIIQIGTAFIPGVGPAISAALAAANVADAGGSFGDILKTAGTSYLTGSIGAGGLGITKGITDTLVKQGLSKAAASAVTSGATNAVVAKVIDPNADIGKAFAIGAAGGALAVNSGDVAARLLGGGDLLRGQNIINEIAETSGMKTTQVSNLIADGLEAGIVSAAYGGNVADAMLKSVAGNFTGTKAGDLVSSAIKNVAPDIDYYANLAGNVTNVAANATIRGVDPIAAIAINSGAIAKVTRDQTVPVEDRSTGVGRAPIEDRTGEKPDVIGAFLDDYNTEYNRLIAGGIDPANAKNMATAFAQSNKSISPVIAEVALAGVMYPGKDLPGDVPINLPRVDYEFKAVDDKKLPEVSVTAPVYDPNADFDDEEAGFAQDADTKYRYFSVGNNFFDTSKLTNKQISDLADYAAQNNLPVRPVQPIAPEAPPVETTPLAPLTPVAPSETPPVQPTPPAPPAPPTPPAPEAPPAPPAEPTTPGTTPGAQPTETTTPGTTPGGTGVETGVTPGTGAAGEGTGTGAGGEGTGAGGGGTGTGAGTGTGTGTGGGGTGTGTGTAPTTPAQRSAMLQQLIGGTEQVSVTPPELADIKYFYDVSGESILPPIGMTEAAQGRRPTDPFKYVFAEGGSVTDLLKILRG